MVATALMHNRCKRGMLGCLMPKKLNESSHL